MKLQKEFKLAPLITVLDFSEKICATQRKKNTITFPFHEPAETRRTRLIFCDVTGQSQPAKADYALHTIHRFKDALVFPRYEFYWCLTGINAIPMQSDSNSFPRHMNKLL